MVSDSARFSRRGLQSLSVRMVPPQSLYTAGHAYPCLKISLTRGYVYVALWRTTLTNPLTRKLSHCQIVVDMDKAKRTRKVQKIPRVLDMPKEQIDMLVDANLYNRIKDEATAIIKLEKNRLLRMTVQRPLPKVTSKLTSKTQTFTRVYFCHPSVFNAHVVLIHPLCNCIYFISL